MKTCSRCKVEKPLDAFSPDQRRSDGVTPWCKACRNEYANQRRATIPEVHAKAKLHGIARHRAVARLIALHPAEWLTILRDEQSRVGITPQESLAG